MAENAALTYKYLSPEAYEFLDAVILAQTSPEEVINVERSKPVSQAEAAVNTLATSYQPSDNIHRSLVLLLLQAFRKFDALSIKHEEGLRRLGKAVQVRAVACVAVRIVHAAMAQLPQRRVVCYYLRRMRAPPRTQRHSRWRSKRRRRALRHSSQCSWRRPKSTGIGRCTRR